MTTYLPLDMVLEIAARSDPATLVRCAATCRAARRRVAGDPAFRRRLRLRHADRFVPSLLRGHLIATGVYQGEPQFVDTTTTADATPRPLTAGGELEGFLPRAAAAGGETADDESGRRRRHYEHVASRDGLVLVRGSNLRPPYDADLWVCDPAARRSQELPAEPTFDGVAAPSCYTKIEQSWEPYVLLVGDGGGESGGAAADDDDGVGRPFQVLKTNLAVSANHRFLQIHVFSSDTGAWGPYTEIRTPHLYGSRLLRGGGKPLVVDGAVHWLCLTDKASYILKLNVTDTAKVTVTALPSTFPRPSSHPKKQTIDDRIYYLLVTTSPSPCASLMVLVTDRTKISAWSQEKQTGKWRQKAQDVVKNNDIPLETRRHCSTFDVRVCWFAERSGVVLVYLFGYGFFWLDLRSMKITRQFKYQAVCPANSHPYEMHLSSWVPTFSATI